jgi:hypothetical protein
MDETGIMLSMLGSIEVLVGKDDRRDYRGVGVKRTIVATIECFGQRRVSGPNDHLTSFHPSDNWTTFPSPGWVYACSKSGYNDSYLSLEWMKRVFDPQTKARAQQRPRILTYDGFGIYERWFGVRRSLRDSDRYAHGYGEVTITTAEHGHRSHDEARHDLPRCCIVFRCDKTLL